MTFLSIARDYLLITLWGWTGVFLALLAAFHLIERTLRPTSMFSRRVEAAMVAAILTIGLFSTWRALSQPVTSLELGEQLRQLEREATEEQALQRRAESLRRELAGQRGR